MAFLMEAKHQIIQGYVWTITPSIAHCHQWTICRRKHGMRSGDESRRIPRQTFWSLWQCHDAGELEEKIDLWKGLESLTSTQDADLSVIITRSFGTEFVSFLSYKTRKDLWLSFGWQTLTTIVENFPPEREAIRNKHLGQTQEGLYFSNNET
jgi:hypothetical protein